jgi:hypothetical protein
MPPRLVVIAGPDQGKAFQLPAAGSLLVGRGRSATLCLADPHVSRSHCQIKIEGSRILIEDLNSAGGIYVNDTRVGSQPLRPGDVLRLGSSVLRLEVGDLADQATLAPPDGPAAPYVPAAFVPQTPARLPGLSPVPPPPPTAPLAAMAPFQAIPPVPPPMPASPTVPAVPALPPLYDLSGKQLAHFHVGQVIAPGKTGVVFRAHDTREKKDVALKVFLPDFSRDDDEVKRFLRAMKTTLRLRHPHLVAILAAGRSGSLCWVAMELVEGVSLAQAVHQAAAGAGDWRVALRVVLHVARALAFLHGHHIVHRNITPANILITAHDGTVKLGDLMKAKAQEGRMAQQVTQAGEILGDLRFMSPEQSTNASAGDGRADLYSLGAVAYALLVGRPPLEGRNFVETILKIRQTPPQPPRQIQPAIPPAFEAVVLKLLAKRPEDRFQSPGELLAHLSKMTGALS